MAASFSQHDFVEDHKDVARALGLLFPIQADADGRWGAGMQGLTTPELMSRFARRKASDYGDPES
jgi:hypothetical protein